MKQKYVFLFFLVLVAELNWAQTNYEVSHIPFQNYSATANSLSTDDDMYSDYINLGFDFTFFGNTYSQMLISTNGYIVFSGATPNGYSQWSISTTTIPNTSYPVKNAIFGCFHDMDNRTNVGSMTYATLGTAPFRKFVLMFQDQPHFSCTTLHSTFQIILYESYNVIDVQINDKPVCSTWNGGRALVGILNEVGNIGYTPENRNTGVWTGHNEGHRFTPEFDANQYFYVKCDESGNGIQTFDFSVFETDLELEAQNVLYFPTYADAESNTNAFSSNQYDNTDPQESVFAFSGGIIYELKLAVVDCGVDFDLDTVPTANEDLNNDGNLANDDTDGDGIPDFLDNDDDGDLVLTEFEYVFSSGRMASSTTALLDTDDDGIPNYLDNDDDGDGVLTVDEDYNGNYDPTDDDINNNSIPDYLDNAALSSVSFENNSIRFYPNPVKNVLNFEGVEVSDIQNIIVYNINGSVVKNVNNVASNSIDLSGISSGIYLLKVTMANSVLNYKIVKQ